MNRWGLCLLQGCLAASIGCASEPAVTAVDGSATVDVPRPTDVPRSMDLPVLDADAAPSVDAPPQADVQTEDIRTDGGVLDAPSTSDIASPPEDVSLPPGAQRSCGVADAGADAGVAGCGTVALPAMTFTLAEILDPVHDPDHLSRLIPGVRVDEFRMDAYEVTVQRFRAFWTATGGHFTPPTTIRYPGVDHQIRWGASWMILAPHITDEDFPDCNWSASEAGREDQPINCVNWPTAQAFCVWDGGRLPTQAEWERAARGPDPGRVFPWGNTPPSSTCDRAQWNSCMGDFGRAGTRRVGSFPSGATLGIHDLAGNVMEWNADQFQFYFNGSCWAGSAPQNPLCTGAYDVASVHGGSYLSRDVFALHNGVLIGTGDINNSDTETGFRCAR